MEMQMMAAKMYLIEKIFFCNEMNELFKIGW
jgi:hypothetical protein